MRTRTNYASIHRAQLIAIADAAQAMDELVAVVDNSRDAQSRASALQAISKGASCIERAALDMADAPPWWLRWAGSWVEVRSDRAAVSALLDQLGRELAAREPVWPKGLAEARQLELDLRPHGENSRSD